MRPAAYRRAAAAAALAVLAASGCGGLPAGPGGPPPALVGVPVEAEAVRLITADDLLGLREIDAFVVSPDGRRVAYLLRRADVAADAYVTGWFAVDVEGDGPPVYLGDAGEPMLATEPDGAQVGEFEAPAAAWSPDGRWLATLKQVGGETQLWRSRADGRRLEQLTELASDVRAFRWSPDGRSIGVWALEQSRAQAAAARDAEARIGFLVDDRFFPGQTASAPTYRERAETDEDYAAFTVEPGRGVRPASPVEMGEADDGAADRLASPDGRRVARLSSDPAAVRAGSRRLHAAVDGGPEHPCTHDACAGALDLLGWSGDGAEIYFRRRFGVARRLTGLYAWAPGEDAIREIIASDALLEGCTLASGDTAVCATESATRPRRLVAVDLTSGMLRTIVDPNPELAAVRFGAVETIHLTNAFGHESFAQILLPPDAGDVPGQGGPYPAVVVTYRSRGFLKGGVGDEYPAHLFAAAGFVVLSFDMPDAQLYPAPDDEAAAWPACGGCAAALLRHTSPSASLEQGLAELERRGLVDPDRIAVTGLSSGAAIVTDALIGNERRYAAAIASYAAGDPITGYVGRRSWREAYFDQIGGLPHAGGLDYLRRVSPALNADAIEAPLLIHVADSELVMSMQTITTLERLKHPLEVHVFPGELHVKRSPAHRAAIYRRNLQWLQFWLQDLEPDEPLDPGQVERWRALRDRSSGG